MARIMRKPTGREMMKIVQGVSRGATVIYPTETCYGLGASALDKKAVKRVYDIKDRDLNRDLICIVPSVEQAKKYGYLHEDELRLCREFMPGPLTLIVNKKRRLPELVNEKFAFRVPGSTMARLLSKEISTPLVSTSANPSGGRNPYSVSDIPQQILEEVDYVVDYGQLEQTQPSTVCEVFDGEAKVYREGPISKQEIDKVLSISPK
ncbi:MAG: L-threonylcarbamoyladenylate synthase [Candidatus Aenigmatarchaeota archaeon]